MSREIRTISHLLHPPLLDESGLTSALRWYVEGFAERSKIDVDLVLPPELGRLPQEMETAIFRVVQESLTNIHRHSASPKATVCLTISESNVAVEIRDEGKGISIEKQRMMAQEGTAGVGIRGMRERIRQLGGSVEVHSSGRGTAVMALLPIAREEMHSFEGLAS
jgi:signal transduction histidine kinase